MSKGHLINNQWIKNKGDQFTAYDPRNLNDYYTGPIAGEEQVESAVSSAKKAFKSWSQLPINKRIAILKKYKLILEKKKEELAKVISLETGKPLWETIAEVQGMSGKVAISIEAYNQRCQEVKKEMEDRDSIIRYKPHGVMGILGPFNFPGHLPNGHMVPALLAGNTVVIKPSELTPLTAEKIGEYLLEATIPQGVVNIVQGNAVTGKALASHPHLAGLLFTGSSHTGHMLAKLYADTPSKMLALEMGGNNPLVVSSYKSLSATVATLIQSAFITSGQRCTCARRLIVVDTPKNRELIQAFADYTKKITVGSWEDKKEHFMGPVINQEIKQRLLKYQKELIGLGGKPIVKLESIIPESCFVTPGIMDVTAIKKLADEEVFGPFLKLKWVPDLDMAIVEANNTRFGLSASLISESKREYTTFYNQINAGIINWNLPTTGAASTAPFGGWGDSGNNRPSAFYAADYCAYPVASMEAKKQPEKIGFKGLDHLF